MSWSIALFEYLLQVPANRIGYAGMTLSQLKILQEVTRILSPSPARESYPNASHASAAAGGGFDVTCVTAQAAL